MSTDNGHEYEDFFRYSSGRWLWNEEEQFRERYKRFDVEELKRVAAASIGAHTCISITKLAEGGYNKVFRLIMDDDSVVIARIPNPNAGPPFKTTASEVATMDFARSILGIPVPKVFSWSAKSDNSVGSEYILMEEATGTQLGEIWDELELPDKNRIVEDIVTIEKKLLSLSFTLYGNLYFAADAFPGCERAEVVSEGSQKKEVERRFVIGPVVDRDFWNKERATMDISRGPWKEPQDYLKAIAEREIAWIRRYAVPKPSHDMFAVSNAQNSPESHIALYEKFSKVAHYLLPVKRELLRSTIWHWDIHAPNIFVHKNKVTALIDWQDVWAGPLFLQVRHPRLVDYNGPILLEFPEHYKGLDDLEEKARIRTQVERSIVLWGYETGTKESNPDLYEIFQIPHGRTWRDTVQFSADTWDGDIIPFRQCLIRIARHWNEFNNGVPCPISFSDEELSEHYRDGEGWNERADFWDSLEGFVHRDGWTSNETYDQALEMFAELREQGLQHLDGDERTDFEKQTRWAVRENAKDNKATSVDRVALEEVSG